MQQTTWQNVVKSPSAKSLVHIQKSAVCTFLSVFQSKFEHPSDYDRYSSNFISFSTYNGQVSLSYITNYCHTSTLDSVHLLPTGIVTDQHHSWATFWGGDPGAGPMTKIWTWPRLLTKHLPTNFHHPIFNCSEVTAMTNASTNKQTNNKTACAHFPIDVGRQRMTQPFTYLLVHSVTWTSQHLFVYFWIMTQ